jgi:hypothetical protein
MDGPLANAVTLAVVGLIVWGLVRAGRPGPVFVIRLTRGEPHATGGTVTAAFLQRVREVAAEHRVTTGRVAGVPRRGRIALTFSRHFPPAAQQQLRNWWVASGWSLPKRRT